jgi:hypothetical protein
MHSQKFTNSHYHFLINAESGDVPGVVSAAQTTDLLHTAPTRSVVTSTEKQDI